MYETNVKRASLLSNSYKFYRYCEKKNNLLAVYVFVLFLLNMKCLEVCCCWLHHIRGLKCFVTITSLKNLVWILRSSHALIMDMHAMVIWGEWNNCTAYIFSDIEKHNKWDYRCIALIRSFWHFFQSLLPQAHYIIRTTAGMRSSPKRIPFTWFDFFLS